MKISKKTLTAFNGGKDSTFNEDYNKAYGLPTLAERRFLLSVRESQHGMFGYYVPVSWGDIKKHLESL